MSDAPTHVIAFPGAKRALCGIKDPLPVVYRPYVQMHAEGHGMEVCTGCALAMKATEQVEREMLGDPTLFPTSGRVTDG